MIEEEHLHYSDKMEYEQFSALHQKYAPNMKESEFASDFLDLDVDSLNRMKFQKKRSRILLTETLPTDEEIVLMKWAIIQDCSLHRKDPIAYARLREIHRDYGGIMPESMFAEKVLDIGQTGYNGIKGGYAPDTEVFLRTNMQNDKVG